MECQEAIAHVVLYHDLTAEQAYGVATCIMSGKATHAQISSLITALRMKGETIDEITGFVRAMREVATPVPCTRDDVIDTCGTGGDGLSTFNISTTAALVAAGAGCAVAKHGNRSVSSTSGSADILEQLGVKIELTPQHMGKCIDTVGFGFLFAPLLHGAMKHALGPRREIGIRTLFNILGPLTNPAHARRQLIGVFSRQLTNPLVHVLKNLGSDHAMVVHGADGLDEITLTGKTYVSELKDGVIRDFTIDPADYGFCPVALETLQVASSQESKERVLAILQNAPGSERNIVLLNAGSAIYIAGRAHSIAQGIELARESIESGNALACLQGLQRMTA